MGDDKKEIKRLKAELELQQEQADELQVFLNVAYHLDGGLLQPPIL